MQLLIWKKFPGKKLYTKRVKSVAWFKRSVRVGPIGCKVHYASERMYDFSLIA